MSKIGQNDLCPCGSGKKYKDCCMFEDTLREKIIKFSEEQRFKDDFKTAADLFFDDKNQIVFGEDFKILMDYFVHDYKLKNYGIPLIELFYQTQSQYLHPQEKEILDGWQNTVISIYEITEINRGKGEKISDIFDNTETFVNDKSSSMLLNKWDIAPMRVIPIHGKNYLTGGGYVLPHKNKKDVIKFKEKEFLEYKKKNSEATWREFMKSQGYKFYRFAYKKSREKPMFVTPEGDPILIAEAIYKVKDHKKAIGTLDCMKELKITNSTANEIHYNWFDENTKVKDSDTDPDKEVYVSQINIIGADGKRYLSMGDITIKKNQFTLSCVSEKRLELGKNLLKKLGNSIEFLYESKEDISSKSEKTGSASYKKSEVSASKKFGEDILKDYSPEEINDMIMNGTMPKEVEQKLMEEYMLKLMGMSYIEDLYEKWVDESIPALGGKSPREASKTTEGKAMVIELIKDIENMEERKKRNGETYYDVNKLRAILGI